MTFAQSVRTCLSKYVTFSGRATRSEFWWFVLFSILGLGIIFVIGASVARSGAPPSAGSDLGQQILESSPLALAIFGLGLLFYLALILPMIAVTVRRFHDRGLSGWLYLGLVLISIVPLVGWIASLASLVICLLPTRPETNRYGPDPRLSIADTF
ncbi:DUF805 domain-containing protein [Stagnihabitans tardus]|uniref:DUF805 domain-containing protein n=1 Tax=Stagnihabitans tardus TaxID=2699202 RepID=A0AAE5BUY0_9RHOB|nr:DUF805 domain-containing protein [Stagnihabitans tardus]NBZ86613.1 DUF805 domain-containing protein [Stagnihabitans tardus]